MYLTFIYSVSNKSISGQEARARKNEEDQEEGLHQDVESLINALKEYPDMWEHPRLKYFRDFVNMVHRLPHVYVSHDGDDCIGMPLPPEDRGVVLTEGFVRGLSELMNGRDICDHPILSVLSVNPGYQKEALVIDDPQRVKLTELRLVDGDGEHIHARLNVSLAEVGCQLKRGDKIRLDMFTEVRYRMNVKSPRMPGLFIHKLSRVGHDIIPDAESKPMVSCSVMLPREHAEEFDPEGDDPVIDPRKDPKPCCSDDNRLCALYGLRFLTCICDAIPVGGLKLATIKQDCYFATDDLNDMTNSHKRNMVYWWYATNVFSIVGKDNIGRLPVCLEYAIRSEYPNPDGLPYKGCRKKKKQQTKRSRGK